MKQTTKKWIAICAAAMLMSAAFFSATSADSGSPVYNTEELFSNRDLKQEADLSEATTYTLSDGQDIHITAEGVYVLTGSATDVTVYVEAGDEDKVQLVLDGVSVTNTDFPVLYGKSADKLFVTVSKDSALAVTGTFASDGDTNTDGVIFSKCDLVLNGTATLTVSSSDNGIVSKDTLKITGATYSVTAASKAIEANDSIRIADGTLILTAGTDGLYPDQRQHHQHSGKRRRHQCSEKIECLYAHGGDQRRRYHGCDGRGRYGRDRFEREHHSQRRYRQRNRHQHV